MPGIRRRRRGRGFSYLGPDGQPIRDAATIERAAPVSGGRSGPTRWSASRWPGRAGRHTHGSCGILPSGTYHLCLPTNVPDRRRGAVELLPRRLAELE
jgi:hypothetical protein